MRVRVMVFEDFSSLRCNEWAIIDYVLDYNDEIQRKRLATSCRDAFEAGQVVLTMPVD